MHGNAKLNLRQILDGLALVGVGPGSNFILHSSLRDIGPIENVEISRIPEVLVSGIRELIGAQGTLCVPAGNWDYGRKRQSFDIRHSRVTRELGVLSQYVAGLPEAERSPNPIFSVAAIGPLASAIAGQANGSAFGIGSAWQRMLIAGFTNAFLGCDLTYLSFTRYIEQHYGVPYLYTKLFDVPVLRDGVPIGVTVTAPLRFLSAPAEYDLGKFQRHLEHSGVLRRADLSDGAGPSVMAVTMADCLVHGCACLDQNIHYFLKTLPAYRPGEVPLA